MDDQSYADAVVFASSLPGAASSKVGIIIGTHRAGLPGGLAAWLGFTTPSALILIAFGLSVNYLSSNITNAAGSTVCRSRLSLLFSKQSWAWAKDSFQM